MYIINTKVITKTTQQREKASKITKEIKMKFKNTFNLKEGRKRRGNKEYMRKINSKSVNLFIFSKFIYFILVKSI